MVYSMDSAALQSAHSLVVAGIDMQLISDVHTKFTCITKFLVDIFVVTVHTMATLRLSFFNISMAAIKKSDKYQQQIFRRHEQY